MDNRERMHALFADCAGGEAIKLRAQWLAALHERGADYVEQAPVIAGVSLRYNRDDLSRVWRKQCDDGVKLGVMLDRLKINRGFRGLSPRVVSVSASETLGARMLPANSSALAQQIAGRDHASQLAWMSYWSNLHGRGIATPIVIWFAEHMPLTGEMVEVSHMADFLRTPDGQRFKPEWRWRDLMTGVTKWEEDFKKAKALEEAKYNLPLSPHKEAPATWENEGFVFTMLNTVNQLRLEGAEMRHCVGGYGGYVENGTSLIYAVTRGKERTGTLQISCSPVQIVKLKKVERPGDPETETVQAFSWRVTQHKAKQNAEPSKEAQQMAQKFLAECFPEPKSDPLPKEVRAKQVAKVDEVIAAERAARAQYAEAQRRAAQNPDAQQRNRFIDWARAMRGDI